MLCCCAEGISTQDVGDFQNLSVEAETVLPQSLGDDNQSAGNQPMCIDSSSADAQRDDGKSSPEAGKGNPHEVIEGMTILEASKSRSNQSGNMPSDAPVTEEESKSPRMLSQTSIGGTSLARSISENSQRVDESDKKYAEKVTKWILYAGCVAFYYDAAMDVIVAVNAAIAKRWVFFCYTLIASYLPGVLLALHAIYWGPVFKSQGYGEPRLVAILQLSLLNTGYGCYRMWKTGNLPHPLKDFVSGMLRKTFCAYPNAGVLTYTFLMLDPQEHPNLRISVLISLSSVWLVTLSLVYKSHFSYGQPFFLEKYRLIKCLSLWWMPPMLITYDIFMLSHRLLFYGLLVYFVGFWTSVVALVVISWGTFSIFTSVRHVSGIGWDPKTGHRSFENWHRIMSILVIQGTCIVHNDCFFDTSPIWYAYSKYVDWPMHTLINTALVIIIVVMLSTGTKEWKTFEDPINAAILWIYFACFFLWLLMRCTLWYICSLERAEQTRALDLFFSGMEENRKKAADEFDQLQVVTNKGSEVSV